MAVINKTVYGSSGSDVPAFPSHAFAIVTSDADTYQPGISVYVGVAGNVSVIPEQGDGTTVVVFKGMPAGSVVPVKVKAVRTASTATDMVGLI